MRHSSVTTLTMVVLCASVLAYSLSYIEAATLSVAGDGHLWNMVFGIIALGTVYTVFWCRNR